MEPVETNFLNDLKLLLAPRCWGLVNRLSKKDRDAKARAFFLAGLGVAFWLGSFLLSYRVLLYFKRTEGFGDILAAKLLSMILLTFFFILIFSNVITSLSSYFLSDDMSIIRAVPVSGWALYFSRLLEALTDSSWMVLSFSFPVFLAYGLAYSAGPIYYVATVSVILPFLVIPAAVGAFVSLMLVNIFPAKKVRNIAMVVAAVVLAFFVVLIRAMRPEKLVNPEAAVSLVNYLSTLRAPSHRFLPSRWAAEALWPLLKGFSWEPFLYHFALWSTAFLLVLLVGWCFYFFYERGWDKSQEAGQARLSTSRAFEAVLGRLIGRLNTRTRMMVEKDVKTFVRDNAQWGQALMLLTMIGIYLYNFSVLPLDRAPMPTFYLQNLISFLNMGLAGFVLAAISVRFIFPSVSLEGPGFWIVKSSPVSLRGFMWSKFFISLVPLLILAEVLIVCSNYLLHVTRFMMWLSSITVFFMTFCITAMGVGLGAIYPRFDAESAAQMASGFGGVVYMVLSVMFVGAVVALEAYPVYIIFMSRLRGLPIPFTEWLLLLIPFVAVACLMLVAFYLPMKVGLKRLREMEL